MSSVRPSMTRRLDVSRSPRSLRRLGRVARTATGSLALGAFALLGTAEATSAQQTRDLRVGRELSGSLTAESVDRYQIRIDDGQFVLGHVNQITTDVVVTVLGPDGEQVAEFDSPARGQEPFQMETEAAGVYVIQVTPFEEEEGDYTIIVERVEPLATDPAGRVDQMYAGFDDDETPGLIVAVYDDGEIAFQKAYGMADLTWDVPLTTDISSNIGSVTKHFTAMAILLLEQDGKLSLDDDIRTHIPELPDFGTPVTLRNLLNHTGGYREIYNTLTIAGRQGEDQIRRDEAIGIVQRQPDLQAPPNTTFNYNNTGYILLGTVVERVTGESFPDFMTERVFGPLGMDRTVMKYEQGEVIPGSSRGYVPAEDGGFRAVRDLGGSAGAGGIYTTIGDMQKWVVNWREGTVGGAEALEAITTQAILESGDSTGYGLGMGIGEFRGRTMFQHTGGDVAHRTFFAYLPELDAGVFISSNNSTWSTDGRPVIEAFFDAELEAEEEEADEEGETATMSPERMEAVTGDWIIASSLPVTITLENGTLIAQPQGQPRFPLRITSDSTAAYEGVEASVVFHFEEDGSTERATHVQGGEVPMTRMDEVEELTAEELETFVGRYYSDEMELVVQMTINEDGELAFELANGISQTLEHSGGTEFSSGSPWSTIRFEQAQNGSIIGFTVGNGRTEGVRFRRW